MISRLEPPKYLSNIDQIKGWLYQGFRWWAQSESDEFTATLTGVTAATTGTVEYSVTGDTVVISFPDITGTSNTTAATLTGMPADLYPSSTRDCIGIVYDNSATTAFGRCSISTAGVITLYTNAASGAFTAANTKGIKSCTLVYKL